MVDKKQTVSTYKWQMKIKRVGIQIDIQMVEMKNSRHTNGTQFKQKIYKR